MGLGGFYIFAAVFGYITILMGGLLILAYKKRNAQMIKVFRVLLVIATFCGFMNIFIDDMVYEDGDSYQILDYLAHGKLP